LICNEAVNSFSAKIETHVREKVQLEGEKRKAAEDYQAICDDLKLERSRLADLKKIHDEVKQKGIQLERLAATNEQQKQNIKDAAAARLKVDQAAAELREADERVLRADMEKLENIMEIYRSDVGILKGQIDPLEKEVSRLERELADLKAASPDHAGSRQREPSKEELDRLKQLKQELDASDAKVTKSAAFLERLLKTANEAREFADRDKTDEEAQDEATSAEEKHKKKEATHLILVQEQKKLHLKYQDEMNVRRPSLHSSYSGSSITKTRSNSSTFSVLTTCSSCSSVISNCSNCSGLLSFEDDTEDNPG
jgi:chromosome segregation ATPase